MNHSLCKAKQRIRRHFALQRARLSLKRREALSRRISRRLCALVLRLHARNNARRLPVALYAAFGSECSLQPCMERLHTLGVALCLPAEDSAGRPCFRRLSHPKQPLFRIKGGFAEPSFEAETVTPGIVICPLLAFDRRGIRLGYGKGYYDRALSALRQEARAAGGRGPLILGAGFACQAAHGYLPASVFDVPCGRIVTERGICFPLASRSYAGGLYHPK